jgi:hypothetical protein
VNRDWSTGTKATGFAAATAGALVGAWLGFNATEDLVALLTATVGAAAGANLTLILLDSLRAPSVGGHLATKPTGDARHPSLETPAPTGAGS